MCYSLSIFKNRIDGRFKTQLSGAQVPGVRCAGFRCQVSDSRCQVPGFMYHAQGIKDQIARDHIYNFRDLIPCRSVENLHVKNILRLNENYELRNTFFNTLIFSLARFKRKKNISRFYDNGTRNKKI